MALQDLKLQENSWLSLQMIIKNLDLPFQIFRLSGIYSNEKNILVRG